ncbi:outer membrane protein [Aquamicrobium segne]|uniref:Outer membrane protein n=1 Tax=Aquamicrobium segne TaxID=469547 RepID=A0ABW0GUF0_9HYPH
MKKLLLASALTALTFSAAQAADAVIYEPALDENITTAFNWTGAYVGAQVGYGWGDSPYHTETYNWSFDYNPDGFFGGLYVGYNHQFINNVVLGVEADINLSSADSKFGFSVPGWIGHVASAEIKYTAAVRARLGYAMDRWLPYIAGGLSTAKYGFNMDHNGAGDWDFREKKTFTGWNIGGGVEYAATDKILIRGEYRFSDFGDKNFDNDWGSGNSIKLRTHDIRLGIAYKF